MVFIFGALKQDRKRAMSEKTEEMHHRACLKMAQNSNVKRLQKSGRRQPSLPTIRFKDDADNSDT